MQITSCSLIFSFLENYDMNMLQNRSTNYIKETNDITEMYTREPDATIKHPKSPEPKREQIYAANQVLTLKEY